MTKVSKVSVVDTAAGILREGLAARRWREKLPGQIKLAGELGVSRRTLRSALARLGKEGLISSAGPRKVPLILKVPDEIGSGTAGEPSRHLRVALLLMTPMHRLDSEHREYVLQTLINLQSEGHYGLLVTFPKNKSPHKTGYLPKLANGARADAWLVFEGTEEILKWFVEAGLPAMALGGRARRLPIASVGTDLHRPSFGDPGEYFGGDGGIG